MTGAERHLAIHERTLAVVRVEGVTPAPDIVATALEIMIVDH
jgi:hypothetical protein